MDEKFSYPYSFMSEENKMTVWAISKLLDGLESSDVRKILEYLQITLSNKTLWAAPRAAQKQV